MSLTLLLQLQASLENIYRLDPAPQVTDFLVETPPAERQEQLVIVEGSDSDLFVGLILDPAIPPKLEGAFLEHGNLKEFCLAVEGVSHYLFLFFCARQHRRTSALELELQGEVDKYVACMVLANRSPALPGDQVRSRLYDSFRLAEGMDPLEQRRYAQANTHARRYARTLEHRFIRTWRLAAMLIELRIFYRMNCQRKLEFIAGR